MVEHNASVERVLRSSHLDLDKSDDQFDAQFDDQFDDHYSATGTRVRSREGHCGG